MGEKRHEDDTRDQRPRTDPNAQFLGEQSTSMGAGSGEAGAELGLQRLIRWFMNRRAEKKST